MIIYRLGSIADNLLAQDQQGVVFGNTSRGIYLHLDSDWMLFLSEERWPGPLTLNTVFDQSVLPGRGNSIRITNRTIFFEQAELHAGAQQARVWSGQKTQEKCLPTEERRALVLKTVNEAVSQSKTYTLLPLMNGEKAKQPEINELFEPYQELQSFLCASSPDRTAEVCAGLLEPFIGVGKGLTPSGDDLILGLSLTLSRWGEQIIPDLDLREILRVLLPKVYTGTTLLSANLIECALNGQADERLVSALDWLACGTSNSSKIVKRLTQWGSSSGMDALTGMALVLGV